MNTNGIEPVDTASLAPWLAGRPLADWLAEYDTKGYVIFENVMPDADVQRVRNALTPHLTRPGRNHFEGYRSNRVYALLAKAPEVFGAMAAHPLPLAFAEAELGPTCLLSAMLAINLHPGETAQGWHTDDGSLRIPRPRAAYGVSAFWAIDDTTESNGATEVIPGSHLWGEREGESLDSLPNAYDPSLKDLQPEDDLQPRADAVKVTLPAGSLMLSKGTLWHRGGPNLSNDSRLIVTPQYCPGWARQLENMLLAVPPDVAAGLPRRVRQLIGYNIHGTFMGYVDGVHPERSLDVAP